MGTIFGRDAEIDRIVQFLNDVPAGPSAMVLAGEAGIGKTTLWKEGVARARRRASRVLQCRPPESEAQLSFTALVDLFEEVLDQVLPDLPPPQRIALEVALFRAQPLGRGPDWSALSVGVLATFRLLARSGPIIVAVDDQQWVDPPSARVLRFAFSRLQNEPIGILAGLRSTTDATDPFGLERAIEPSRLIRLDLGPLDLASIGRLVQERLHEPFSIDLLRRFHRLSEGNPFYALELARAALKSHTARSGEPISLPESLSDLVRGRVEQLPSRTLAVLRVVASLSHSTVPIVEVAGGGARRSGPALRKAADAGVIEVERERIYFTHPLLGSAIYDSASPAERRRIHRRLSEVIRDPEERARHLALATDAPDPSIATCLDEAAGLAKARNAFEAAARLLEDASRFTPSGAREDGWRRLFAAIECYVLAGDRLVARALTERLITELPPGPMRAEALWVLGRIHPTNDWRMRVHAIEEALSESEDDPGLQAKLYISLAWADYYAAFDLAKATRHAETALELAESLSDRALLARALLAAGAMRFFLGRTDALTLLERAVAMEDQLEWVTLGRPSFFLANVSRWTDQFQESREELRALSRRAAETGDILSSYEIDHSLCELECWAGEWHAGLGLAEGIRRGVWMSPWVGGWPLEPANAWARLEAHLGRVDEARMAAEEALAAASSRGEMEDVVRALSVLGFLELSLGEPGAALSHLGRVAEILSDMEEPGVFRFSGDYIEALIALDRLDEAKDALERLERQGTERDRPWALATAGRCRALLLASLGDLPGAIQAARHALEVHERLPMPFELGRTLLAAGTLERRVKHKHAAREILEQAVEIFGGLGARLWSERARAELARIGGRAPAPLGLTPTEERVAELVAAGHTNQETAAALFMSVRTVEANLGRIYRKLGVRSRTELSVKMAKATDRR